MEIKTLIREKFDVISQYAGVSTIKSQLLKAGALVVEDPDNGLTLGILTPKDVLKSYNLVADCLPKQFPIDKNCKMDVALRLMKQENLSVLPVYANEKLQGLLFKDDMLEYLSLDQSLSNKKIVSKSNEHLTEDDVKNVICDNSQSVIFLVDKDYKIIFFNKKAFDNSILYHQREIKKGDSMLEYIADTENNTFRTFKTEFEKSLNGEIVVSEKEIKYSNEKSIWVRLEYMPAYQDNLLIGIAIYVSDITDIQQKSLLIKKKNDVLEKILWVQNHKIRQPVASILGLIPLLDKNEFTGDNRIAIELMEETASKLDEVIKEINDMAQMASVM